MKKKIFSAICLLLSAVCIFSACRKDNGNGGSDEQTGSAASGDSTASSANDLVLPYSNNDSLNPFFAVGTENISLTDLAYDPLFKVKADYTPENVIAEKGDISGTSVTVTLSGARFSDPFRRRTSYIRSIKQRRRRATGSCCQIFSRQRRPAELLRLRSLHRTRMC